VATIIEQLLIIQEHDRKAVRLGRELLDIPKRKEVIDSRLNAQRESMKQADDELKLKLSALNDVENSIESLKAKIIKYRQQQFEIKSNVEYKALEKEIASAEKDILSEEDNQLEILDELDGQKERMAEIEKGMKADEEHITQDMASLDKRAENLEKEIAFLKEKRAALTEGVPAKELSRYERIFKHMKTHAIMAVQHGACGGCHMKLPPQAVNDARKEDRLTLCSYCGCILYRNDL